MGKFSNKKIKILLLRNRKEDEAETWHTCMHRTLPSTKVMFFIPVG